MPKILLISYHFPPDSAIGAVRAGKFAKYLPEFGWEPVILTVKERYYDACDHARMDTGLNRMKIHRCTLLPGPLQFYSMLKRGDRRTLKTTSRADWRQDGCDTPDQVKPYKKFLSSILRLPDPYQGWILNVAMSGLRILKKEGADVFMTSGPPMSTHLGGLLLKKMSGVRWVADFRDPWTSVLDVLDGTYRSDLGNNVERRLERMVVKAADVLVSTAPSVTGYFQGLLEDGKKNKAVTITNGYDSADFAHLVFPETGSSKVRISHAGSLYLGRSPEPLFRALSSLIARGAIRKDEIEVDFIGDPDYNGLSLSTLVEKHGLTGSVRLSGKMPFDKCLARLMQSHGLLLFAQGQPQAIPGKVFEYLATNKPMLVIAEEGDTKDLLNGYPRCFVANPSEEGDVEEKLLKMAKTMKGNAAQGAFNNRIEQYERRNLTGSLASLLLDEGKYRPSTDDGRIEECIASR